ncbi:NAD(P)-dependent oxidoreductase [Advenella mimigardefordensis]|uniref:Putative 3-hydroxyacid dehydrogenase n=1 Tax=Advenella mimigardefordensis (strain DSM 17166 / LMG 22922 / DPN7) TaxID=1247726 RepID=W0PIT0_ADVMD|nr:NAD(P)-dependent oxidoreductase [Advenella mimigardefordensis]AHG65445.1 putative 3-hydroxyacid dehydrogenase [Advenella mimigardefordensis DPN7]
MKIGFVGLGKMGLPMMQNLSEKFEVQAFDGNPQARAAIREAQNGSTYALLDSLDELVDIDILILMLPNGRIVQDCVLPLCEREGALSKDAVVIDMSSSSPLDTLELHKKLAQTGIALLDAPVSGSVQKAKNGTLAIMVGGETSVLERVRPALEAMGTAIIPTGKAGSAHSMKTLNNYVYAAGLMAVSEALIVAEKLDLDLEKFTDVLNASSGRNVATETKVRQHMLKGGDFSGGFGLHLMAKDLGISHDLAQQLSLSPGLLGLCFQTWQSAIKTAPAQADNLEIHHHLSHTLNA